MITQLKKRLISSALILNILGLFFYSSIHFSHEHHSFDIHSKELHHTHHHICDHSHEEENLKEESSYSIKHRIKHENESCIFTDLLSKHISLLNSNIDGILYFSNSTLITVNIYNISLVKNILSFAPKTSPPFLA